MIRSILSSFTALGTAVLLAACASGTAEAPMQRISELPPMQHAADNPATPAKLALGAQRVLDSRLSGSGSVASLRGAVKIMANGGGTHPNKSPILVPTGLAEAEIDQVVASLQSLTSTEVWVAPKLP